MSIVVWPVLGYWDLVIVRLLVGPRSAVVLHDPAPLVRAVGYGRAAKWLAGRRWTSSILTHSATATSRVRADTARDEVLCVPHPMMAPRRRSEPAVVEATDRQPLISVLGQYKRDRDLHALARVAAVAHGVWKCEIWGRGWPEVAGWRVKDRFLSEAEFAHRIEASDVVLIPYLRFFQSGVAMRCLELGTPFVGPSDSSLGEIVERESEWLVVDDDWAGAVRRALMQTPSDTHAVAARTYEAVVAGWGSWLRGTR